MEIIKLAPEDINELTLLRLSREIARDIHPIENILDRFGIDPDVYETIQSNPRFQAILQGELEAWQGASNTSERVKIKSLSFVEELLPEMYERAHDPREPLSAKVELLKTIGRFGGVGLSAVEGGMGEKLSVTINLGSDSQLKFEKDVTPQVVDVSPDAA